LRLAALALLALAACQQPDPFADAKAAVAHELKDPESAQFRDLKQYGDLICGEVNAKNSYGGYVGFEPFYTQGDTVELAVETGDDLVDVTSRSSIEVKCLAAASDELRQKMQEDQ
jgi:hypothetical protein